MAIEIKLSHPDILEKSFQCISMKLKPASIDREWIYLYSHTLIIRGSWGYQILSLKTADNRGTRIIEVIKTFLQGSGITVFDIADEYR